MRKFEAYKNNALKTTNYYGNTSFLPVNEECAKEINRFDWNVVYGERKRDCSFDQLLENGGEHYLNYTDSFEDTVLEKVVAENRSHIIDSILHTLSEGEINILKAEKKGISSSRDFEKIYGTPRRTYLYRRKKIFNKLRSIIETQEREHASSRR